MNSSKFPSKLKIRIATALTVFFFTSLNDQEAVAASTGTPEIQAEKPGILLAQAKKRKKKKKKRKKTSDEAPAEEMGMEKEAGAGSAGGEHGAQEATGNYKWQISLLSDFKIVSQQTGDAKSGSGKYDLDVLGLYIIGNSIEVGGGLVYNEETVKFEESSNKTTSYLLRFAGVYNFGNLNTDSSVFFTGLNLGVGSRSSKTGDADEQKSSVTQFGLGVGMHWFVDSNVAFTAEFRYDTGSLKTDGADEPTKFSEIHIAKLGFSLFL